MMSMIDAPVTCSGGSQLARTLSFPSLHVYWGFETSHHHICGVDTCFNGCITFKFYDLVSLHQTVPSPTLVSSSFPSRLPLPTFLFNATLVTVHLHLLRSLLADLHIHIELYPPRLALQVGLLEYSMLMATCIFWLAMVRLSSKVLLLSLLRSVERVLQSSTKYCVGSWLSEYHMYPSEILGLSFLSTK